MGHLLEVRDLHVSFGDQRAVDGLSLTIDAGETLALVGESGCGKSTTALSLLRLLPPSARLSGEVWLDGQNLLALPEPALQRVRGGAAAMVFQEPMTSLNPVLTVGEQLVEAIRLHQPLSRKAATARAEALLALVRLPEPRRRMRDHPHQLSGGQRQRVMIAMAVAGQPKLLIADEPTTALDVTIQAEILALLGDLQREFHMGMLLITHDLGLVAQWADRVAVMFAGRAVEQAPVRQLFRHPQHDYTRGLMGASLQIDQVLSGRTHTLPEIRHGVDADGQPVFSLREATARPWKPRNAPAAGPLLSVQDLHTVHDSREGPVHAVRGVSFDIHAGETLGLVGESGCGKSTLSKTLVRLLEPTAGRILLDNEDIAHLDRAALRPRRRRIQMVFQDPYASLNPRHTVQQILESALVIHGEHHAHRRIQRVLTILDQVGLPRAALQRHPHQFSGGQRQRIAIARALVLEPALVVCDEPVSALDVSVQAQILNLLVDLQSELGLAYLLISHDLSVVRFLADRVLVMQAGQIVESGDRHRIWSAPQHPYTRTLLAAVPSMAVPDEAMAA
ncbi:ABC transporter ATP-binding protein [Hydrogenophaga sp. T2]|uniref:ABC transporter ATP-binding protein n=1 Tax=Hydrogenophaga sp. T2 TaxID=3132823 RepID=UPI003CE6CB2D